MKITHNGVQEKNDIEAKKTLIRTYLGERIKSVKNEVSECPCCHATNGIEIRQEYDRSEIITHTYYTGKCRNCNSTFESDIIVSTYMPYWDDDTIKYSPETRNFILTDFGKKIKNTANGWLVLMSTFFLSILVGCVWIIIDTILKSPIGSNGVGLCWVGMIAVCCAMVPTINNVESSNRVKRNLKCLNNYLNTAKEPVYFWGKDNQMCEALNSIYYFREL